MDTTTYAQASNINPYEIAGWVADTGQRRLFIEDHTAPEALESVAKLSVLIDHLRGIRHMLVGDARSAGSAPVDIADACGPHMGQVPHDE